MRSPHCNDGDIEASKVRVRRSVAEKRRIVELTFQSGQSVARVAQAEGVNSHQVFQWRRAYRIGELAEAGEQASSLLPVIVSAAGSAGRVAQVPTSETGCPRCLAFGHLGGTACVCSSS